MARFDQGERVFLEAIRSLTISSRGFRWHAGSPSRFPPSGSPRGLLRAGAAPGDHVAGSVALDGAIQLRLAASPDPSGERVLEDFAARHLARQPIDLPEQRPVDGDRDLRFGRHGMTIYRTIRRMTSRPATPPPLLAQRQGVGSQRFCFTELVPA